MRFISLFFSAVLISGCASASSWYLGEWAVSGVKFPAVSALSLDEAQEWFGAEVIYAESSFLFRGAKCDDPNYTLEVSGEPEFRIGYRTSFSQLGMSGETVDVLRVRCAKRTPFPEIILIKDTGGVVYLPWDGAFFRLERSAH